MEKKDLKYEELKQNAEVISLAPSAAYVSSLLKERSYKVISAFPTINGINCHVKMDTDGNFKFRAERMNSNSGVTPADFQNIGYGFGREFGLKNAQDAFIVPFGAGSMEISLIAQDMFTGSLFEIESILSKGSSFLRCILPLPPFFRAPLQYFESDAFRTETSFRVKGLIKLKVSGHTLTVFDYDLNGEKKLFIDSKDKCDYKTFCGIVKALTVQYGIISGSFLRGKMLILFANDSEFANIVHHSFAKLEESKSGLEAVRPRDLVDIFPQLSRSEKYLSSEILENLITLCLSNASFLRATTIIAESHDYPPEIRTATYCVALETLKNIIILKNAEKINPIKNKSVAKKLIEEIKTLIGSYPQSDFNNLGTITRKIDHLNQIGNTDSFTKIFELLDLKLTEVDKKTLERRNDFLHGRIPFEENQNSAVKDGLVITLYRLHLLLCAIILKMGGYNGYLFNNLRLKYLHMVDEEFYRKLS